MVNVTFDEFRDAVLEALEEVGLSVKIFGGVAVSVYDKDRDTIDIDMAVRKDLEDVNKLIVALESIGFSTKEKMLDDIFGADPHQEEFLFAMCRLTSDSPKFSNYHIDLCFEFGSHSYETLEAEETDIGGNKVLVVTLPQLIAMKKKVNPPRPQDIKDIQVLSSLIEDDVLTPSNIFTGRKNNGLE